MKAIVLVVGAALLGLGLAHWCGPAQGQTGPDLTDGTKAGTSDSGNVHLLPGPRAATDSSSLPPAPPPSPRLNNVVVTLAPSAATTPEQPSAPTVPGPPTAATPARTREPIRDESRPSVTISTDSVERRSESAVSIDWMGSPTIKMHQPADYTLVVRNNTATPLQEVHVRVRVPTGLAVYAAEPRAATEGRVLIWELGTLAPNQAQKLQVRLAAEATGELVAQAWATFSCASALSIRVQEPKLVLKTQANERVALGDAANIVFTVSNTGEGIAEQVKIQANLSEGLEHPSGKHVELKVGALAPGESRSATLVCSAKTGGKHSLEACAVTETGLAARDQVTLSTVSSQVVVQAKGPALRYLERKASYTFRVHNPGDSAAQNVVLRDAVPSGMKFIAASDGGQPDAKNRQDVSWRLGDIGPGQAKEVRLEVAAVATGEQHQRVAAQTANGQSAEVEVRTRVEGVAAIMAEVVDTDDPVEVGADTTYEVRLINAGSKEDTDVKLVCTLPDNMEFKAVQGPCRYRVEGKNVVFEPLPRLAPRGDALFRITARCMAPADARFKLQVSSASLSEPILRTESTRVYADAGQ